MKQKKSKLIYYIIGFSIIAGIFYVATHEVAIKIEHIEQPIPNTFLSK